MVANGFNYCYFSREIPGYTIQDDLVVAHNSTQLGPNSNLVDAALQLHEFHYYSTLLSAEFITSS